MNLISRLSAYRLHQMLSRKELSCTELVRSVLSRMEEAEPLLGCYITTLSESALAAAKRTDRKIAEGETLAPLEGIPIAVKDNICTQGIRTTCASRMLENFIPPYDATAVTLLKEAGAILLGKTNMDESGMGSSTEHSYFKRTKHPTDPSRVPGGSSGGSAAAVASGSAVAALGSDTGGSVRQPAAFCGVVGCKPTYGLVSRYGLVAFASSLDQIGPITRDVTDCALLLSVLARHDPKDSTSVSRSSESDYLTSLPQGVSGLSIGLPKELLTSAIRPDIRAAVLRAAERFRAMGARVEECSLPHAPYALPVYYIVSSAEASSNLARYDGVSYGSRAASASSLTDLCEKSRSEGFGDEVKRRIMLGTFALSTDYYDRYYQKAQKARTLIQADFDRAFSSFDLLLSPTAPTTAWHAGEVPDGPRMYAADLCTVPVSLAGIPAVSMPVGEDADGLPIGLQLIGPAFSEARLLRAAYALEQALTPSPKGGAVQ